MQSNNPIFNRSDEFRRGGAPAGQPAQPGYSQYGDPSTWGTGTPGAGTGLQASPERRSTAVMTIDSVVQKTGISLGAVIAAAAITWILTPDVTDPYADLGGLYAALTIGSLGAFALSMVNSFKRVISPVLVIAFCAMEGVALGAFSKVFDARFGDGIVTQAVIGTFMAFAGTLAAYKFLNITVGQKFRTFVVAAMFGMIGLSVLEVVLGAFGSQIGLFGFGGIGALFAVAGLALGVFMLILDFDFVEQGVANQIPERESWRAAFAMTVSLVWIYTNLLRLLAIFGDN